MTVQEARQLVVDEILNGELQLANITPLRKGNQCCFWGIACEAYHKATGRGNWQPSIFSPSSGAMDFRLDHRTEVAYAPLAVQEWMGASNRVAPTEVLAQAHDQQRDLKEVMVAYIQGLPND